MVHATEILARLPSKDFQRLRRSMKLVELSLGKSLYEPFAPLECVYFPEDGVASLLTRLDDGIETEVATVGREGMVGLPAFFGVESVPGRAIWQVSGKALMLPTKVLRRETRFPANCCDIEEVLSVEFSGKCVRNCRNKRTYVITNPNLEAAR